MKAPLGKLLVSILSLCAAAVLAEPPAASQPASRAATTASALAGDTAQGMLVSKGEDWISVKAQGDKTAVRYTTDDKDLIAAIGKLTVPSQVKVSFKKDGEARKLLAVQSAPVATSGVFEGILTAKGDRWIEAKPLSGDGPAERYLTYGDAKEVVAAIAGVQVGDKVRVTWKHIERKRVMKLEKIGAGE